MPVPIGPIGYEKLKKFNIEDPNNMLKKNLTKDEYRLGIHLFKF